MAHPDPAEKIAVRQLLGLFPGLCVTASATTRGLKNGRLYKVLTVDPFRLETSSGDETVEGDPLELCQHLRAGHSLTHYSAQSLTLPGTVRVYTRSKHFTVTALCVALSRATHGSLVEVL